MHSMLLSALLYAICLLFSLVLSATVAPSYTIRKFPGTSVEDTYAAVRRAISGAAIDKRETVLKNSTTIDTSWEDATLLKLAIEQPLSETNRSSISGNAGIEVVCTECYVKGVVTAEFLIDGEFNVSQAIDQTFDQIRDKVENFTDTVDDYFFNYTKGVVKNFKDGIDIEDFAFPTFPFNYSMEIPTIPQCNLRFTFDELELFINVDTIFSLGATYELNLYSSTTPIGISITKDLEVGVIFTIDLILSAEGAIDISSGFHIKLDDGLAIDIALFGDDVSEIVFNGGQFEFLPVTVQTVSTVFSAVLRVGIHAGFQLVTPSIPELELLDKLVEIPKVGGGIEVGVFANVAEFTTNITLALEEEEECKLQVVQSYQLALGAALGATVEIGSYQWGPVAETSVPIFYTEIASACAIERTSVTSTPTITSTAAAEKRDELTTTTLETTITYTGVSCMSIGLVNCPVALQNTTQSTETKTLVTAIPSGSEIEFPPLGQSTVTKAVDFGSNAVQLPKSTGSPVSYVPPPPPPPQSTEAGQSGNNENPLNGEVGGVNKKLIVGLSVGIGVPVIIALIAGAMFILRRRRSTVGTKPESVPMFAEPYGHNHGHTPYSDKLNKRADINVSEVR